MNICCYFQLNVNEFQNYPRNVILSGILRYRRAHSKYEWINDIVDNLAEYWGEK